MGTDNFSSKEQKMKFFSDCFKAIDNKLPSSASPELVTFIIYNIISNYGMKDTETWGNISNLIEFIINEEDSEYSRNFDKTKMIEDAMDEADVFLDKILNSKCSG